MTSFDPSSIGAFDLSDPAVGAETLAQIASTRRDLWPAILDHPNCYPALRSWIAQQMPSVPAPPTQPPASKPTTEQWAARFLQTNGREAAMSEYQQALADGEIAQEPRRLDPTVQQMSEGARQMASGAKEFLTTRVAPAAQQALRSAQTSVSSSGGPGTASGNPPGLVPWINRAALGVPAAAFLAIISLFLPVASGYGLSAGWFSDFVPDDLHGEGAALLVFFLLTIGTVIAMLLTKRKWARITAGIIGLIAGIFGAFDGFVNMGVVGGSSMSVGVGLVFLAIFSTVVLLGSILILLGLRGTAVPTTPSA